ncbi:MAG TPA: hypothetical protein DDX89_03645 [Candidatus Omnitrophica bacterium]|nr:MAG: hypothetical protein A2105_05980 [Omnitrophica WOR_2 bacterium GWF2_63_9]HAM40870.1 hypothetical protein [Candidatus Omnitrophota bacterium]HBH96873.1 hypothetical protein [Candidatus Omnitrophota bacterium]HBQ37733.1 hypothetical protein [Candidatus Omnitrophota bacterium]
MKPSATLLRVLDANLNRAREGLRVCEDLIRFDGAGRRQVERLRGIRHALTRCVQALPVSHVDLLRARDSRRDAGRWLYPSSVESPDQLLLLNLQRAKEAMRVIEESVRVLAPPSVTRFQQLRFRLYDAERDVLLDVAVVRHRGRRSRQGT